MSNDLKSLYNRKEELEKRITELKLLPVTHFLSREENEKNQQELVNLEFRLKNTITEIDNAFKKIKVREEKHRK